MLPRCLGISSSPTQAREPPRYHRPTKSTIYNVRQPLAHISPNQLPARPLRLVELCGGQATCIEAFLMIGSMIDSYTWADVDPDAHRATSQMLTRLRGIYSSLPHRGGHPWLGYTAPPGRQNDLLREHTSRPPFESGRHPRQPDMREGLQPVSTLPRGTQKGLSSSMSYASSKASLKPNKDE